MCCSSYSDLDLVKDMVCPVVMYGYESWTIKKAEKLDRYFQIFTLLESPGMLVANSFLDLSLKRAQYVIALVQSSR